MNKPMEPLIDACDASGTLLPVPEDRMPAPGGVRQVLKGVAMVLGVLAALAALGFVYVLWAISHMGF